MKSFRFLSTILLALIFFNSQSIGQTVTITSSSATGRIMYGGTVTYTASVSSGTVTNYRWQVAAAGSSNFVDETHWSSCTFNGNITLQYCNAPAWLNGRKIRCYVTVDGVEVLSNELTLYINYFTGGPYNTTACASRNAQFVAYPTNLDALPTYQWEENKNDNNGWNPISISDDKFSGAKSRILYILDGKASTSNGYKYHCIVTWPEGSLPTNDATLTIVPDISGTISILNPTLCTGSTTTITASPTGGYGTPNYLYQWTKNGANISGATSQTYSVPTSVTSNAGSYNYSCRIYHSTGCNNYYTPISTLAVVNRPADPLSITCSSPTICAGQTGVTYSVGDIANATGYIWTVPTGATIVSGQNTKILTVNFANDFQSGDITVEGTNGTCNSTNKAIKSVTATPLSPATITASGPTTFCEGGSVTLTASEGASYLWSTGATTSSINVTTAGNYDVRVTNASGCQTPVSAPVNVTVNPTPTASITASGPTTFCEGGSVTLTASEGASYIWSNGATTNSINITTSGNYDVRVTSAQGCQSAVSAPVSVTINPLPTATVTASGPTIFCEGGSVTLTASEGASYVWSTGATTNSIDITTSGNYDVRVTNAQGCQSPVSATTTVTVNPFPAAVGASLLGTNTVCAGQTGVAYSFNETISHATSYYWECEGAVIHNNGERNITIDFPASTSTTHYYLKVRGENSCGYGEPSNTIDITAKSMPTLTVPAVSRCGAGNINFTSSSDAGNPNVSWYLLNNTLVNTGEIFTAIVSQTTTYKVIATGSNGCTHTELMTATINEIPVVTVPAEVSRCGAGQVTLTAATTVGTLKWYNVSTGGTQIATQEPGELVLDNQTTSQTFYVEAENAGCISTRKSVLVKINPIPDNPVIAGNERFGPGDIIMSCTLPVGVSIEWFEGSTSKGTGEPFTIEDATQNTLYTAVVTNAQGCTNSQNVEVKVLPEPVITAAASPAFESVTVEVDGTPRLNLKAMGGKLLIDPATTESWQVLSYPVGKATLVTTNTSQAEFDVPTNVLIADEGEANPDPLSPVILGNVQLQISSSLKSYKLEQKQARLKVVPSADGYVYTNSKYTGNNTTPAIYIANNPYSNPGNVTEYMVPEASGTLQLQVETDVAIADIQFALITNSGDNWLQMGSPTLKGAGEATGTLLYEVPVTYAEYSGTYHPAVVKYTFGTKKGYIYI